MRHKKIIALLSVALSILVFFAFSARDAFMWEEEIYDGPEDLTNAYQAVSEIAAAERNLEKAEPATVITNDLSGKKQLALTIDGMMDRITMQRILDLLKEYDVKATFFVEGINAAADPESVAAIGKAGHKIGNYTYVGLAHADHLPQSQLLQELCRTQSVLQMTAGAAPTLFKCAQTVYTDSLLQVVNACGLESAVKTNVYVGLEDLETPEKAAAFAAGLKPGSIVSIRVGKSVEVKAKSQQQENDKPAIDKKPTLTEEEGEAAPRRSNVPEALKRLFIALRSQQYDMVFVENFRKIKYIPADAGLDATQRQKESLSTGQVVSDFKASLVAFVRRQVSELFSARIVYAASREYNDAFEKLREQNQGKRAEEIKMVLTTEQAVPYTFVGLGREETVHDVLQRLDALQIKATFFVLEREIRRQPQLIREIIAAGHEIGIAFTPKEGASFAQVCMDITRTRDLLKEQFGITTDLVKQPWGKISDVAQEAVSALKCRLIGQTVNVVQSKHKDFDSAHLVMSQIFGRAVHSVGRGWIIHFRMDFYTNPHLVGEVAELLKKEKIDNIAYYSFDDGPDINPENDSSYVIRPLGKVLDNASYTYAYPVAKERVPRNLRHEVNRVEEAGDSFEKALVKRYIGANDVKDGYRMLGFSNNQIRKMDITGCLHTEDPVVFFGMDDWGTDAAVNKLLYVFRKHKVRATFFILTTNVTYNPNLLRAIAAEGHEIACHTNSHLPMVRRSETGKQSLSQSYEAWLEDLSTAYEKLESIVGDVAVDGKYSLTRFFRPPTLAISKSGVEALFANGYEYIVSGSTSTDDYAAKDLQEMIERIKDGLYRKGEVKKGAIFVMHMTDAAQFTPKALDAILTVNERKPDGDPTKFIVGRLSDYLVDGYDQSNAKKSLALARSRGR